MPRLLRTVARTAVIAGTATTVSNRVSRRQGNRWAQQEQAQAPQEVAPPPPAAPPAPPAVDYDTKLAQLRQLGELHDSGVLDDAEFALQKSKILGS